MCVGIPTHVKYNALFNLVPILWYWLGTPEMKDIYERLGICKIFVKYLCKYRMHHPVFGNTHTCLDFPTHVWFLPNTSTCLRYLGKTTHVCEKPHTWKFRKSVVIPTHVWFLPNTWKFWKSLVIPHILVLHATTGEGGEGINYWIYKLKSWKNSVWFRFWWC